MHERKRGTGRRPPPSIARRRQAARGGSTRKQREEWTQVSTDPDLRNYLRAPYDPVYSAQATRFFAAGLIDGPPWRGWMPALGLAVALALLSGVLVGGGLLLVGLLVPGNDHLIRDGFRVLLPSCLPGFVGALLVRRLLR